MKLSIIGCPDKKRFRPYVKRSVQFYANKLMSDKMLDNIFIRIKFNSKIHAYGYASVIGNSDSGKAREFEIEIHPGIGAYEILSTLAHEMVHVKQFAYSEMNQRLTRWYGTKVPSDTDYYSQPWEIEANGMSQGLFMGFVKQEQLWNTFAEIGHPDEPIKPIPIKWKENIFGNDVNIA